MAELANDQQTVNGWRVVKVQQAKTQLSALLAAVEQGQEIVIARGDVAIAKLVGIKPIKRELGFVHYQVPARFFEDLSDDELAAWEVATKNRLGKLPQADVILAGFNRHLDRLGCRQLPVSVRHALRAGALDWDHRDPFDRMLAAQSMIESLPLATSHSAFNGLPGLDIVW